MATPREKILELLDKAGAVRGGQGKHWKFTLPDGRVFGLSRTPSDFRADLNALSDLRKILGLVSRDSKGYSEEEDAEARRLAQEYKERKSRLKAIRASRPVAEAPILTKPSPTPPSGLSARLPGSVDAGQLPVDARIASRVAYSGRFRGARRPKIHGEVRSYSPEVMTTYGRLLALDPSRAAAYLTEIRAQQQNQKIDNEREGEVMNLESITSFIAEKEAEMKQTMRAIDKAKELREQLVALERGEFNGRGTVKRGRNTNGGSARSTGRKLERGVATEAMDILAANNRAMSTEEIFSQLNQKFPDATTKASVYTALQAAIAHGRVTRAGRGMWVLASGAGNSQPQTATTSATN